MKRIYSLEVFKKMFVMMCVFSFVFVCELGAQESPSLTKMTDHVYAYIDVKQASPGANSFGANCGVIIGADSVLVVDTLVSAKHARTLINQIKEITDKSIKYAVNTHYHLDHSWGNSEFSKNGALIIMHNNMPLTTEQIEQTLSAPEGFGLTTEDLEDTRAKMPDLKFNKSLSIDLGGVTVVLNYPGDAHTNDNITVFVKEDNVLFSGDIIFNKYHPFLGEGNIPNWIKVLSKLEKSTADIIIPGHGPVVGKKDIRDMIIYLKKFDAKATKLSEGKTQDDAPMIAAKLMEVLPNQGRNELPNLVEMNLRMRYLPQGDSEQ